MSSFNLPGFSRQIAADFALTVPSLEFGTGEWICITGTNGAGKTLLLEVLAGLRPECAEPGGLAAGEIAVVQANPENQFFFRQVEQELVFPLENRRVERSDISRHLQQVAGLLQLTPLLQRDPWTLSGGQKQLVVLATALMQNPDVWLLDDALAYLDRATADRVLKLLATEREQGKTIISVTQDVRELERADRVVHLEGGAVRFSGAREEFDRFVTREAPEWRELLTAPVAPEVCDTIAAPSRSEADPLLRAEELTFAWPSAPPLFQQLALQLSTGGLVHLRGAMGSGKTTLALLLAGLLETSTGRITFEKRPLHFRQGASFARNGIGYTFQYPEHQFCLPTLEEELACCRQTDRLPAIRALLERFDLPAGLTGEKLSCLARGHQRLLALFELLTRPCRLFLLDEPFIGLDLPTRQNLMQLLRELCNQTVTLVVIDHLATPDQLGADRVLQLEAMKRAGV